jgi:alkylation response protein AidB-like acyl-CoA dehydrogenase
MAALVGSKVGRCARFTAQEAVQVHGAMGVCEELPIASAFRALMAFAQWGGDGASHALTAGRALLADGRFAHSRTLGVAPTRPTTPEPESVA